MLLSLALTFSGSSVLAADSPVLQQAIKDYNARSYKAALDKLQTLPKTGPGADKAHYYMGLCYQSTNQIASATSEYTTVYQTSRDNTLRYQSSVALQGLQKWGQHRSYTGNGNNFAGTATVVRRSGGG